jgi:hypothetical protein
MNVLSKWCTILIILFSMFITQFFSRPNQPTTAMILSLLLCAWCCCPTVLFYLTSCSCLVLSTTLHAGCNSPRSLHSSLHNVCLTIGVCVWSSQIPRQWQTPVVFRPVQHGPCLVRPIPRLLNHCVVLCSTVVFCFYLIIIVQKLTN